MKQLPTLICLILLFFFQNCVYGQPAFQTDTILVGSSNVCIYVLPGFKKWMSNYEEGTFITYTLADSSYFSIRIGCMIQIPELNFDSSLDYQHQTVDSKEVFFGQRKNGTYYREITFNSIDFQYDNVKSYRKEMFDFIIDNITVVPK